MTSHNGKGPATDVPPFETVRFLMIDLERHLHQLRDGDEDLVSQAQKVIDDFRAMKVNYEAEPDQRLRLVNEVVRICVRGRLHPVLAQRAIPHPAYNYFEAFDTNATAPWDTMAFEPVPSGPDVWVVLGHHVGYPIGVAASCLTANSRWIEYYARRGFNILTYKSVRTRPWKAHPEPNWLFLHGVDRPWLPDEPMPSSVVGGTTVWPDNPVSFSMANSLGVPSEGPAEWQQDVAAALRRISDNQLLIVSVMATHEDPDVDVVEDFATGAALVAETGAPAVELNLSCPNTVDPESGTTKKGQFICEDAAVTRRILETVREKLAAAGHDSVKLTVKCSYMSQSRAEDVLEPLAEAGLLQGISGINTMQTEVRTAGGTPAFAGTRDNSEARAAAGVSGVAIREYGVRFVRNLAALSRRHSIDLLAMGGVMTADDVFRYRDAGAASVQTATAAFFNPSLARQVYRRLGDVLTPREMHVQDEVLSVLGEGPRPIDDLAHALEEALPAAALRRERTRHVLRSLVREGLVAADLEGGRLVFKATPVADADGVPLSS